MESENFFEKNNQQEGLDKKRSDLLEKASILAGRLAGLKDPVFIEKFIKLRSDLVDKYGKDVFYRCELYHKLNNSGIKDGEQSFFDLPENEFEAFINENIDIKEK